MLKGIGKTFIGMALMGIMAVSIGCGSIENTFKHPDNATPTPIVLEPLKEVYDAGIPINAPETETWISPATYTVENYYAGYTINCVLRVHNGNSESAPFSILYTQPDSLDEGFSAPPSDTKKWVNISDSYPIIEAYETKSITITMNMTEESIVPDKWMFWICVKDISQDTMVQTRLCSKVKITME